MDIVVLTGGTSSERDVALSGGASIYKALKSRGHKCILLDAYLGYSGDIDRIFESDIDWEKEVCGETKRSLSKEQLEKMAGHKGFLGNNVLDIIKKADFVFIAMHGIYSEDGRIQACLELLGIPYNGTGHTSSAIAMNKCITKDIFFANGVKSADYKVIRSVEEGKKENTLGFPVVIKKPCEGSSIGVSIVEDQETYEKTITEYLKDQDEVLVEKFVSGREFTVGVFEDKALPVVEIIHSSRLWDYNSKYDAEATKEVCPANITEEENKKLQEAALFAYHALRIKKYARMDFIMTKDGEVYCLEANTLPGMTSVSLFPKEAQAIGLNYEDLCEEMLK